MPRKEAESALAQATKDTTFLATCFKHLKQQPQVDAAAVADELKMSTGGVRNKLRPILKAMEDAGAGWLNEQASTSTPKRAGGAKPKAKATGPEAKNGVVSDKDDGADPATPKPKAKAVAKAPAKAAGSAVKRGRKAKGTDTEEEGATTQNAAPRKKLKLSSLTTDEDENEGKGKVKQEIELVDAAGAEMEEEGDDAEVDGTVDEIKSETEHD